MVFLDWHYSEGISFYLKLWKGYLSKTVRFFSLPILINTLFAPWKRISVESQPTGFNWSAYFDELSFNITSRLVGFFVRFWLIVIALLLLLLIIPLGLIGLFIWLVIPPIGFPVYQKLQKSPEIFTKELVKKINISENPTFTLFDNEAGKFVLAHVGLTMQEVVERAVNHFGTKKDEFSGYADLVNHALESGIWPSELWRELGILSEDLLIAARIWDEKRRMVSDVTSYISTENAKGIGMDLLFGYTPTLDKIGKELRFEYKSQPLRGRDGLNSRIDRILSSHGSIVIVGQPGVGKKAILLDLARKLDSHYQRLIEVNVVKLTAGVTGINEKKFVIQKLLSEVSRAGNVIIVLRDLPRLTSTDFEGIDFTDVFEERMEGKKVQIIAVATPEEYEKYLARNHRLMKYFEKVEVEPLNIEAATQVLIDRAAAIETTTGMTIPIPTLRKMVASVDRYYSDVPFPKKALEILESVAAYSQKEGKTIISPDDVAHVISEKTGIPTATLTASEKRKLANIEDLMQESLVGQETALSLIAQSLRSRTMGVSDDNRPIGTFLFLGPTGVGKTETAKVLSRIYFGHTDIMRFDMAEFVGFEGVTKLIGSAHLNQPGILTTSIKNNPAGMILFDELEKASEEVFNILLTMVDEGYIVDAFGKKIDCRNVFVIATSNAGSELIRELVQQELAGEELQKSVLEHILAQRIFSPEFVNRFDGVVVYEPLSRAHLTEIAKIKLSELKARMLEKNIDIHLDDSIYCKVADDGYDPVFGARPMRRVVDMVISDAISQAMLSEYLKPGDKVAIHPGEGKHKYFLEKI